MPDTPSISVIMKTFLEVCAVPEVASERAAATASRIETVAIVSRFPGFMLWPFLSLCGRARPTRFDERYNTRGTAGRLPADSPGRFALAVFSSQEGPEKHQKSARQQLPPDLLMKRDSRDEHAKNRQQVNGQRRVGQVNPLNDPEEQQHR